MAGFSYRKPGINSRVPNNKTSYDGKFGVGEQLSSPYSTQFPGSSPYTRLDPYSVFDKMQTARTTYVLQDADFASPFISGQWSADFSDEFPNTSYTVLVSVEDPNASFSSPAQVYVPGHLTKTTTGVKGRLTCPFGNAGRAIVINVIAIAD